MILWLTQVAVFYLGVCTASFACTVDPRYDRTVEVIQNLTADEVCRSLVAGLQRGSHCDNAHYGSDGITVDVFTVDKDEGFVRVDFKIVAPSDQLSGIIGGRGYESHAFEGLLFLGLDCLPKYWVTPREPRYIRGHWTSVPDPGNVNWTLYTDGDRIGPLRDKVQSWFILLFKQ